MKRRTFFSMAVGAAGGSTALGATPTNPLLKYLCPPDDIAPDLATPSPASKAFVTPLFVPKVMQPVTRLDPAPDPAAHQLYDLHKPKKLYETHEVELNWQYHKDPPYANGSFSWGYQSDPHPATTPGPTYHARYGEPVLVRRFNDLPTVGYGKASWALPSTASHLHNGHTASESDGNPQDWIDSGEFWDHHYGNFPSGGDPREKLTTLWYHDHRLDFTAANVYAGLAGFYFLFDERDTGYENPTDEQIAELKRLYPKSDDPRNPGYDPKKAWKLPSGDYDIPLLIHDVLFYLPEDQKRKPKDEQTAQVRWDAWNTDGIIGDMYTVNRKIRPVHKVDRRRYRFRLLNGGPSRFYQFAMFKYGTGERIPFTILTGDGNLLPRPIDAEQVYLSPAQRIDFIFDFTKMRKGDKIVIVNLLEQTNGKGPSGRVFDPADYKTRKDWEAFYEKEGLLCFEVGDRPKERDHSWTIPEIKKRVRVELPDIDLRNVKRERLWTFDYDGGLWTVNGKVMEPNRIDAGIEMNSDEIWTFRNTGNTWAHPVHCHFTEFIILEINGKPFHPAYVQTRQDGEHSLIEYLEAPEGELEPVKVYFGGPRRDVATILAYDEMRVLIRFRDFLGKHVMHCHNVVHEDHAMMIRWDMLPKGEGFAGSKDVEEVYGSPPNFDPHFPDPRKPSIKHLEERPGQATIQGG